MASDTMFMMNSLKREGGTGLSGSVVTTLVRALSGEKALYSQILDLARQQSMHVASGENEQLMTVLAARNRLIEQVAPLDRELQPFKGRWQETLDGLPVPHREVVGKLLKEVQQLLSDILNQDERDKESLVKQKTAIGSEIKRAVSGVALNKAYGKA